MSPVFAFTVARPIETGEQPVRIEGSYDTDTQTMVWEGDADAVLAGATCTGYPIGAYLHCQNIPIWPPQCSAYTPNPGIGWGYRCDAI